MFLLAAVALPVLVDAPSVSMATAVYAPDITTRLSLAVLTRYIPSYIETTQVVLSKQTQAKSLFLVPTATTTPNILVTTKLSISESIQVITSGTKSQRSLAVLASDPDPGKVYPPGVDMDMVALAPEVQQFTIVLVSGQDDGNWPAPEVYVARTFNITTFALDETKETVSPYGVSMVMTPLQPAVTLSSNLIISAPSTSMVMTTRAPAVTLVGNPSVSVPGVATHFSVYSPIITLSNFGINTPSAYMVMTPLVPTVASIPIRVVTLVGRITTDPKLLGATENLSPPFNFQRALVSGEMLQTASVTASVYSGTDPSPAAIVLGTAVISGARVDQLMTGGVVGCMYELLCEATTSLGHTLQQTAYFYVEPDLP